MTDLEALVAAVERLKQGRNKLSATAIAIHVLASIALDIQKEKANGQVQEVKRSIPTVEGDGGVTA